MQLPNELNSKRQDPEDEYKTKMYQLIIITILFQGSRIPFLGANRHWDFILNLWNKFLDWCFLRATML